MSGSELDLEVVVVVEPEVSARVDERGLAFDALARRVLDAERAGGRWEVAFVLVDDDRIRALHRRFMGIDEPTDVMTFERDPGDSEPGRPAHGGDIVISLDRVEGQTADAGHDARREFRFVAIHGLLHLTGWGDGTDAERAAMLARGETLLRIIEESERDG